MAMSSAKSMALDVPFSCQVQGAAFVEESVLFGHDIAIGDGFVASGEGGNFGELYGKVHVYELSTWNELIEIPAPGLEENSDFGQSLDADGNTLAIGAFREDCFPGGPSCGAVHIYDYDGFDWEYRGKVLPPDPGQGDQFGEAVAIDGDTLVVGATGWDNGTTQNVGAVYVFEWDGNEWIQQIRFEGVNEASTRLGNVVEIDGNTIVAGAALQDCDDGPNCGAIYIYENDGNAWAQIDMRQGTVEGDNFGHAVSINNGRILATAIQIPFGEFNDEYVHLFEYNGSSWEFSKEFLDPANGTISKFGESIAIDGDRILINSENGPGIVYRFMQGDWVIQEVLQITEQQPFDRGAAALVGPWAILGTAGPDALVPFLIEPGCDCNNNGIADQMDILEPTADCNLNAIVDSCELDDCNGNGLVEACEDCNQNGTPDYLDIEQGVSFDANFDDVPDECSFSVLPAPGDGCSTDADCQNQSQCVEGTCYVPKHRYLTLGNHPLDWGLTARRISLATGVAGNVVLGWQSGPINNVSSLAQNASYRKWCNESSVTEIADCAIVPGHKYYVQAITLGLDESEEANFSQPVEIPTTVLFGDIVGEFADGQWTPPNGTVSLLDVFAISATFQQMPGAPPLSWVDLANETPNRVASLGDMFIAVKAFRGEPYPYSQPGDCN